MKKQTLFLSCLLTLACTQLFAQIPPADTLFYSTNKEHQRLSINWQEGQRYTFQVHKRDVKIRNTDTLKNKTTTDTLLLHILKKNKEKIDFNYRPGKGELTHNFYFPGCEGEDWKKAELPLISGQYFLEKGSFAILNYQELGAFYQVFMEESVACMNGTDSIKMMASMFDSYPQRILEETFQAKFLLKGLKKILAKTEELIPLVDTVKYEVMDYNDAGDTISFYKQAILVEKNEVLSRYRFEEDPDKGSLLQRLFASMGAPDVPQMKSIDYYEISVNPQLDLLEFRQVYQMEMIEKSKTNITEKFYHLKRLDP